MTPRSTPRYEVERNRDAFPFQWEWRALDASGQPKPDGAGYVRTHAGYPFRWMAALAARIATVRAKS